VIGLSYAPFYIGTPNTGVVEDAADLHNSFAVKGTDLALLVGMSC
jgi:hypothetical protein